MNKETMQFQNRFYWQTTIYIFPLKLNLGSFAEMLVSHRADSCAFCSNRQKIF